MTPVRRSAAGGADGPVTLVITGMAVGGAERVTIHLAEALAERGWPVDLVVCRGRGPLTAEVPATVRLVELGATRLMASLPALVRYWRRARPRAVLAALSPANCLAVAARRLARVPSRLVVAEHTHSSTATAAVQSWRARLLPALMRRAYPRADAVVAVSAGVADDLAATLGLPRAAIAVIPNPIITPRLERRCREAPGHPWCQPGAPPLVLAVGRLVAPKDLGTLLRAFARLRASRTARLLILGEGEQRPALVQQARALGVEAAVDLPGAVANPYAYMGRASVLALSSRFEGLPTVLIEALACGTPVVSTACPAGPAEILDHGRWGRLVPVGDAAALATALAATLDEAPAGPPAGVHAHLAGYRAEAAACAYERLLLGAGPASSA